MEKTMSDVTLACPDCGSDNVHIVIGEASGRAIFADEVFDDRDDAMCGDCHYKEQAAAFISVAG